MTEPKWYVALGNDPNSWIELDELPYVFLATEAQVKDIEKNGLPPDCTDEGALDNEGVAVFEAHIHVQDLMEATADARY